MGVECIRSGEFSLSHTGGAIKQIGQTLPPPIAAKSQSRSKRQTDVKPHVDFAFLAFSRHLSLLDTSAPSRLPSIDVVLAQHSQGSFQDVDHGLLDPRIVIKGQVHCEKVGKSGDRQKRYTSGHSDIWCSNNQAGQPTPPRRSCVLTPRSRETLRASLVAQAMTRVLESKEKV